MEQDLFVWMNLKLLKLKYKMKRIKETCYKGTRILIGNQKRELINQLIKILISEEFEEISIPILQFQETFNGKVGEENNNMMFNFKDRANRDICLAPEYTAIIQKLAKNTLRYEKNLKLFYVQECFRGETPQKGRYRQFTQLGVEIINPIAGTIDYLTELATRLVKTVESEYEVNLNVKRGLDYYKDGNGFEIRCPRLGSVSQICGGGEYDGGIGFAIGIDRLLL